MLAFIANESGWVSAEVGRQPWIVYPSYDADGQWVEGLRTVDGVSEMVTSEMVIGSIVMFGAIYALLFALWVFLLNRAIQKGPDLVPAAPSSTLAAGVLGAAAQRGAIGPDEDDQPGGEG